MTRCIFCLELWEMTHLMDKCSPWDNGYGRRTLDKCFIAPIYNLGKPAIFIAMLYSESKNSGEGGWAFYDEIQTY